MGTTGHSDVVTHPVSAPEPHDRANHAWRSSLPDLLLRRQADPDSSSLEAPAERYLRIWLVEHRGATRQTVVEILLGWAAITLAAGLVWILFFPGL